MGLIIDSVELIERGKALFKSVYLEVHQSEVTRIFTQQTHATSTLLRIIHFQQSAEHSYLAIHGHALVRKASNMVLLPAEGLLPKRIPLQLAFEGYGCSWRAFQAALPTFKALPNQLPYTLSAGERRICELYLCLHLKQHLQERWILLDQPFMHLSPIFIETAVAWIMEAKKHAGLLLVDTQPERANLTPERNYLLQQGRITPQPWC